MKCFGNWGSAEPVIAIRALPSPGGRAPRLVTMKDGAWGARRGLGSRDRGQGLVPRLIPLRSAKWPRAPQQTPHLSRGPESPGSSTLPPGNRRHESSTAVQGDWGPSRCWHRGTPQGELLAVFALSWCPRGGGRREGGALEVTCPSRVLRGSNEKMP